MHPWLDVMEHDGMGYAIPVLEIKVGQSFFLPTLKPRLIGSKAIRLGSQYSMKFVWKRAVQDNYCGIRVWRVT